MLDLPTDDMAAAEAARPRPQGGTQSVWMLLELVMLRTNGDGALCCATEFCGFPSNGCERLLHGRRDRSISCAAKPPFALLFCWTFRTRGGGCDGISGSTGAQPADGRYGEVRCAVQSEQCAGDTRWRGFEVGFATRRLVERMQERTR